MKYIIQLLILVIITFTSSIVVATTMCATSDIKLDYIQLAYPPLTPVGDIPVPIPLLGAIDATDCIGLLKGNDNPSPTGSNIGTYKDGLLNGANQLREEIEKTDNFIYRYAAALFLEQKS